MNLHIVDHWNLTKLTSGVPSFYNAEYITIAF